MLGGADLSEERGGSPLAHFLAGGEAHGVVGSHEQHILPHALFGREPLEKIIGVRHVANVEWPDHGVLALPIEHDDSANATEPDEARKRIYDLIAIVEPARVE